MKTQSKLGVVLTVVGWLFNVQLSFAETAGGILSVASESEVQHLGVKDVQKFGVPAFKDRAGVIWGKLATNEKGSILCLTRIEAQAYCENIGARLASEYFRWANGQHGNPDHDSDFVRLRSYVGATSGKGVSVSVSRSDLIESILAGLTACSQQGGVKPKPISQSDSIFDRRVSYTYDGAGGRSGYVFLPVKRTQKVQAAGRAEEKDSIFNHPTQQTYDGLGGRSAYAFMPISSHGVLREGLISVRCVAGSAKR